MTNHNLRYYALASYTGLIALFVGLDKLPLTENIAIALLAPIGLVIGADMIKARNETK
jgi:hypothetical protein